MSDHIKPQDTTTIVPSVLISVVRHAACSVEGISRMGNIPVDVGRLFRGHPMGNGVVLNLHDANTLSAEVYLIIKQNTNMYDASRNVQEAVKRAITELVGMDVRTVNVHIEDVDYPTSLPTHS